MGKWQPFPDSKAALEELKKYTKIDVYKRQAIMNPPEHLYFFNETKGE